ncbi:hypothetical protein [Jeotgalibacillus haloalkalitolerans]|uniref:DUF4306 domain-containing protein n=1 Tax=Jeotgalibacillus haloalkalitolerans TaxID=3104292 RepID=A0ABU5KN44_9BACL|nr:hypothetical protein [Jeotgalibacillus sp. HH7-29]MDZ5712677.1 hypothetical protein [Jeotgalibacillus sp. HH7-29]
MKSAFFRWGIAFILSAVLLVGTYYFTMDLEFAGYDVTEQGQFVLIEGWKQPSPFLNTDVSSETESLAQLGADMERFNQWLLIVLITVAFFIATYYALFNKHNTFNPAKRRKFFYVTIAANAAVAGLFIFQFIHFVEVVNNSMNNVLF